ncbi:MAG: pyruvate, phosphate dikinase [Synergistaceae bacterium]|jgi:pyruvate,orthophosphate dikinase|uniref:pyruvate, phosphate dikinase n=1 Tax=Aminivibrio sp. TaxID=1872489 RepID=UPI002A19B939|nr:pyruvate, phosphate dikinase [Synergistaceae bacterium]MDD3390427.1 pyruvate, phosphate dikinase [Synergistaceae bacterium]MDD3689277.1 pyruvate, phosphate dikinase [Synergistaceae bacterium]MDD4020456.1 pyruvate, phosphate dikinase [Synergistaceae bacterium]MDD4613224.1 pyruvate, phosphate dikinase [Synergistaceae bacterium]
MNEVKKYVYSFEEGNAEMKDLLGGKGANLAQMVQYGLPVPPGFILTTEACLKYGEDPAFLDSVWDKVVSSMKDIEKKTGKTFGSGENPLLVSVRSGAPISMPGMMDTVLNLGLNDESVESLARVADDRRFAFDSFRRFIQMYGNVVHGVNGDAFEEVLEHFKSSLGVKFDNEIPAEKLVEVVARFKEIFKEKAGFDFPADPWQQLRNAVEAVFKSWGNPRAVTYRRLHKIPHTLGTAVNIVSMVYGNLGDDCGTGVCFTRNPSDGTKELYGEFLINAQGEDVVAGIRTPLPIVQMKTTMPEVYNELFEITTNLEKAYKDMQDIEFTIERNKLYILQTRNGKRSAGAAVKIAVDMVAEGLIDKKTAVGRVTPEQVEMLLHRQVDPTAENEVLAKGLPASPGAGVGVVCFDADDAVEMAKDGQKVILARPETCPDDIHGLFAAEAIVTSRGGMTSHAAVVARGLGKPCVSGCEDITIDLNKETITRGDKVIRKGDTITVDGSTGRVLVGGAPLMEASFSDDFQTVLSWSDEFARLQVWANGDTPEDAKRARAFGAKGIGLCRTEHMFMATDRLPVMQRLVVADTYEERLEALEELKVMQVEDFYGILKEMHGLPVIIRLLDPPLHEFMPKERDLEEELAELTADGNENTPAADKVRKIMAKVEALKESNPMLGFRGCRLGIVYPEISAMQSSAIFEAVLRLVDEGIEIHPEIMIPLVGVKTEMEFFRKQIDEIAKDYMEKSGKKFNYLVGTMIEVPHAALVADQIAEYAEFFSFGTNDLTQTTFGYSRDDAEGKFLGQYEEKGILPVNPFHELDREGVGVLMEIAVEKGRKVDPNLSIGICGEHGGNPSSIAFCHTAGLNYVSCSPFRVPVARISAAHAAMGRLK